jgi:hypothetical protein
MCEVILATATTVEPGQERILWATAPQLGNNTHTAMLDPDPEYMIASQCASPRIIVDTTNKNHIPFHVFNGTVDPITP